MLQVGELPAVLVDPIAVTVSRFPSDYTDPESVSSQVSRAAAADGETYDVMDHSANSIAIPTEVTGEVYEAPVPVTQSESETYEFPLVLGSESAPPAGQETNDEYIDVPGEVYEAPVPVTQSESETYEFPLVIGSGSAPPAGPETNDEYIGVGDEQ